MTLHGVLHISNHDSSGGAGLAAYRLHSELRKVSINSRMIVAYKSSFDTNIFQFDPFSYNRLIRKLEVLLRRFTEKRGYQNIFFLSNHLLANHKWIKQADIINIHHIQGGYFSVSLIPELARRKKVVWTFHDMWPITGYCAYSRDCDRWKFGCGNCPLLGEYGEIPRDTSALMWQAKKKLYPKQKLTIISPSQWLATKVKSSPLLEESNIVVIPHGVNLDLFKPLADRQQIRAELGLPIDSKIIMFSAYSIGNRRKGSDLLLKALYEVNSSGISNVYVVFVGSGEIDIKSPFPIVKTGLVRDEELLAKYYGSADLFVLPTREDNLPLVILESLACGTPVVAFRVGGVPEAVTHMKTGYLAMPEDDRDLALGMKLLLLDDSTRREMSILAREDARQRFDIRRQVMSYLSVYDEITL